VLQFADNRLLLEYEGGDTCGTAKAKRRTKIYFTCVQDAGKGAPTFVAELDGCVYVFEWKTAYACTPEVTSWPCLRSAALPDALPLD